MRFQAGAFASILLTVPPVAIGTVVASVCYVDMGTITCCDPSGAGSEYGCTAGQNVWDCVGTSSGSVLVQAIRPASTGEDGKDDYITDVDSTCTYTNRTCSTKPNQCITTTSNEDCVNVSTDPNSNNCTGPQ